MIDREEFEKNFASHYKHKLDNYGIDIVRLPTKEDMSKYRGVEFLTRPLDEENVSLGYLRSHTIAEKYGISLCIENFGRGEGETILRRSFVVRVNEYNKNNDKKLLKEVERLKSAEDEFYNR